MMGARPSPCENRRERCESHLATRSRKRITVDDLVSWSETHARIVSQRSITCPKTVPQGQVSSWSTLLNIRLIFP
jgi:hypothetical protein